MQVARINKKYNSPFGNRFYDVTQALDSSVMLSRALVDGCGCTIPWIIMANNKVERKEKARRFSFDYAIAYLSPFIALPLWNRLASKSVGKYTKKFWSDNHKVIHISNKFLTDPKSMMAEIRRMKDNVKKDPLDSLYYRLNHKKQYNHKLDINELLTSCNGDEEKLRQKIINAKETVFILDCISTFGILGSVPFINNEITKSESKQTGFSAEMSMADKETVEKRAAAHEKNKTKKYFAYLGILGLTTIGMSLLGFSVLKSKTPSKYVKKLKKSAKLFDYGSGIYMSRLPFFLGYLLTATANILAARNSTERKDLAIRQGIGTVIFFGGDLLLSSLFTNLSDRIFGTKLRKDDASNKYLINKIFPKVKPFKQVIEEVKHGKISKVNKKVAAGIFWSDMLLLMGAMGYAVPTAINKMIKHDVEKDVQEQNKSNTGISISEYTKPIRMNDFIKKIRGQ